MGIGEEGVERREMEGSIVLKPPFVYVSVCVFLGKKKWIGVCLSQTIGVEFHSFYAT